MPVEILKIDDDRTSEIVHSENSYLQPHHEPKSFQLVNDIPEIMIKSLPIPNFLNEEPIHYQNKSTQDLLDSYQNQILLFDEERNDFETRLTTLSDTAKDFVKALNIIQEKNKELERLQNALSDAHIYLYEERQKILKLREENQKLNNINQTINSKLQCITTQIDSTEQEVLLEKDKHPSSLSVKLTKNKKNQKHKKSKSGKCIIRTVYLPQDDTKHLKKHIKFLESKLIAQEKLLKDREHAFMQDRTIKSNEHQKLIREHEIQFRTILDKMERLTTIQYSTMKDYLTLKRKTALERSQLTREIADTITEKNNSKELYELGLTRLTDFAGRLKQDCVNQVRLYLKQARLQLIDNNSETKESRKKLEITKKNLEQRLTLVSEKYLDCRKKLKNLQLRRCLEVEGYKTDIKELKKKSKKQSSS